MKNPAAVTLGTLGGKVKSETKAKTSAANGVNGGRPKMETVRTTDAKADDSENCNWYVLVADGYKETYDTYKQACQAKAEEGGRIVKVIDSGHAACSMDEHKIWIASHVK